MTSSSRRVVILVAEDDADDRILTRDALADSKIGAEPRFVEDGEELIAYLRRTGRYADAARSPRPELILLDLKMPRMDGFDVLRVIKNDPELRRIPVVVLSTSNTRDDIRKSYDLGVNSYSVKPSTYQELVKLMSRIGEYWFRTVEIPHADA